MRWKSRLLLRCPACSLHLFHYLLPLDLSPHSCSERTAHNCFRLSESQQRLSWSENVSCLAKEIRGCTVCQNILRSIQLLLVYPDQGLFGIPLLQQHERRTDKNTTSWFTEDSLRPGASQTIKYNKNYLKMLLYSEKIKRNLMKTNIYKILQNKNQMKNIERLKSFSMKASRRQSCNTRSDPRTRATKMRNVICAWYPLTRGSWYLCLWWLLGKSPLFGINGTKHARNTSFYSFLPR